MTETKHLNKQKLYTNVTGSTLPGQWCTLQLHSSEELDLLLEFLQPADKSNTGRKTFFTWHTND